MVGIAIERSDENRGLVLTTGILANVLTLAFFKYFGLIEPILESIEGVSNNSKLLKIILPIGLSYFIFTAISYLIEIKRGAIRAEKHIGVFASALMFFPKIMMGPIEKPGNVLPQFEKQKPINYEMISDGLKQMLWGYFKKLVVADRLAIYVNAVFDNYERHSGITLAVATILYSFQIYADFSGYTDIALGSARTLGFNLTNNFNRPYFSSSVKDFWNRWHISLSVWLRDYIFLPLSVTLAGKLKKSGYLGIRVDKWIFMIAALITFAICGIWHGESLNYLIWGLIFGIYLTVAAWKLDISKYLRKALHISKKSLYYRIYSITVTFVLVSFAWIFFRADTLQDSFQIIGRIFSHKGGSLFLQWESFFAAAIALAILFYKEAGDEFFPKRFSLLTNQRPMVRIASYACLLAIIVLLGVFDNTQFLYFQY
jgi:D-alanyl-lipoteichoic acid acyltransferase DltB (MBOAT superfamily)